MSSDFNIVSSMHRPQNDDDLNICCIHCLPRSLRREKLSVGGNCCVDIPNYGGGNDEVNIVLFWVLDEQIYGGILRYSQGDIGQSNVRFCSST